MKSIIVLLALVSVALAMDARHEFTKFQQKYGKTYASQAEFNLRFKNFQDNLKRNEKLSAANPQATFGINKFSDLSVEEFSQQYLMHVDLSQYTKPAPIERGLQRENVRGCDPDPDNYNWQSCGATTPIYNQGQCGSCWAFSATETIESYFFLSGGTLTQLSIEQIVDCDTTDDGCDGGLPTNAYQYVENAGGLDSYNSYPYTAESGVSGNCSFKINDVVCTVTGYNSIDGETGLYEQTSAKSGGPVSVCVDASTWQTYTSGILTSCPSSIDHCVQLVGYADYSSSNPYWIVRNSWGTDWGMNGLIYIAIGQDLCAIGDEATVVTVGPKQ